MNISASISGFTDGEQIYLKAAFFKEGSTNYFGFIKKGEEWVKNSTTALEQKQITIGSWDGNSSVKSDFSDTGFSGSGSYNFKLGFYYITSGGNTSSINWSENVLSVKVEEPISAPVETVAPTQALSVSSTTKAPTASKTSIKTPTPTVVKKSPVGKQEIKSNSSAKITHEIKAASQYAKLKLSLAKKEPSPQVKVLGTRDSSSPGVSFIGGIAFLLLAVGWVLRTELRKRNIL